MPRLIDADKLKEELSYKSPAPDFDIDSVILGVIDEQPTVAASPWHRVEEELPPKGTWVLTVATDGNVKLFNIATVDAGGQWWTCSPQNILGELYGVRYWMPIEPPQEDA